MATKDRKRRRLKLPSASRRSSPEATSIQDFVVITGFSGAGKSQAMACFEDAGYFCVDNLPPEMIGQLADLFAHEGSKVERAAVVCDVRGGEYFEGLVKILEDLEARGTKHRLLFLDASEASRNSTRWGVPRAARSSSTRAMPSKEAPPRASETIAARRTFDPSCSNRSTSDGIISGGRLSTQK